MTFKLGIDCDGVLFDFTSGYRRKLEEVSGKVCTLPEGEEPAMWYWATKYGFDKGDDNKAWESIKRDDSFWATLAPKFEADRAVATLNALYLSGHEVYFVTNRMGVAPHAQTLIALTNLGMSIPQILISENKGPLVVGLGLSHFIDDKPSNCEDAAAHTLDHKTGERTTRVFCLTTNYNKDHVFSEALKIDRVSSLREFFDILAFEEVNSHAIA